MERVIKIFAVCCACAMVAALLQACRVRRSIDDYEQTGTEKITRADSTTTRDIYVGQSIHIDTSAQEIEWEVVTYDTEKTDSDGKHPVASVSKYRQHNRNSITTQAGQIEEKGETATRYESVEVVDSTKAHMERAVSSPWYNSIYAVILCVAIVAVLSVVAKKLLKNFDW